jgi:rhomboid family GlyGly-CTERM serine protease
LHLRSPQVAREPAGTRWAGPRAAQSGWAAWQWFVGLGLAAAAATLASRLDALAYVRAAVLHGEAWRLATCHLVHAGVPHLGWNLAGLGLVALAVGPALTGWRWFLVTAASASAASLGVLWLAPQVQAMAGLSGILHGQLAGGAWATARRGERLGWALLALLAAKLLAERLGPLAWSASLLGARIAIDGHLYGALGGLAAAALLRRR